MGVVEGMPIDTKMRRGNTKVFENISQAIEWVEELREKNSGIYLQLLVCGSLHLVGGVMKTLGYDANNV